MNVHHSFKDEQKNIFYQQFNRLAPLIDWWNVLKPGDCFWDFNQVQLQPVRGISEAKCKLQLHSMWELMTSIASNSMINIALHHLNSMTNAPGGWPAQYVLLASMTSIAYNGATSISYRMNSNQPPPSVTSNALHRRQNGCNCVLLKGALYRPRKNSDFKSVVKLSLCDWHHMV